LAFKSRYTEVIRLCFQHKWIASLGNEITVLFVLPFLWTI
jgi:hypothetical protein